jgi:hypothetical protein
VTRKQFRSAPELALGVTQALAHLLSRPVPSAAPRRFAESIHRADCLDGIATAKRTRRSCSHDSRRRPAASARSLTQPRPFLSVDRRRSCKLS